MYYISNLFSQKSSFIQNKFFFTPESRRLHVSYTVQSHSSDTNDAPQQARKEAQKAVSAVASILVPSSSSDTK